MKSGFRLLMIAALAACWFTQAQSQSMDKYVVSAGTRIPLVLVNSVSTKNSREGDRVYLQTSFPIAVDSHIVIPEGSYVTGTITQIKRAGRVKGRAELYVRFDTLMLPNGVQRDFRARMSAVDGDGVGRMKEKEEGKVEVDSSKGKDVGTMADIGMRGAEIGAISGAASSGAPIQGAALGGGIGAAAGLVGVLVTRGPDLRLPRGSSVEMQLDRELAFQATEVNFLGSARPAPVPPPPAAVQTEGSSSGGRWGGPF
jgi:hypothetical protein